MWERDKESEIEKEADRSRREMNPLDPPETSLTQTDTHYFESLLMTRMRAPFSSRIFPMSERSSSNALWDSCVIKKGEKRRIELIEEQRKIANE